MDYEIVVAGGGPVGLMLACELGLAGTRVLVLEQRTDIDPTIKAGAVTIPTMEVLHRRGLLPAVTEAQKEEHAKIRAFVRDLLPQASRDAAPPPILGHFGAIMLDGRRLDEADPDLQVLGPAAQIGGLLPQQRLEAILEERAVKLGVDIRRGSELTGFTADDDGVTVSTGHHQRIRASWLVGCDGGRSLVRNLAGFDFPGTDPEITGHQAIVELHGADQLGLGWNTTERGYYVYGPMPGRILTVEFDGPPQERDEPVTAAEVQASLRHVSGQDVTVTSVHTATRFTDHARQASHYRTGRVLLAGDAAHVHSPFGGQGLNLGIGDAVNLGWKLAATARGQAPPELLDTYTSERHPIAAWVLEWTRAQVALMRPERKERALRAVVADLAATTTGTTYFAKKISGTRQRYDLAGDHPLTGGSAPDLTLADGSHLGEHLHDGQALLLDLGDHDKLRELGALWGQRLRVVSTTSTDRPELTGMLVRPDGFVAWVSEGEPDLDAARTALETWLGTPG